MSGIRQTGRFFPSALVSLLFFSLAVAEARGAEPFKKIRIAIPSIVIDFAPVWIAREKGFFRDERIDPEITYIQGNIKGVQALIAGEVQFGIAGSAGPIGAKAAGEETVIGAVPMNRLDYTLGARLPLKTGADFVGSTM